MSTIKISALPVASSLNSTDVIPVVQSGATKQAAFSLLVSTFITPTAIPSGSLMLFQQTSAPTGWTKQTTHNDKALRVVSGTASSGGATAFTSVFGSGKSTGSYTLQVADIPSHTHGPGGGSAFVGQDTGTGTIAYNAGAISNPTFSATAATGGGGGHSHTLSLDLQYVDLIIASKD